MKNTINNKYNNFKQKYPKIGKRVYKTRRKSWRQVYYEMLDIIKGEPHPRRKTRRIELNE
jgi:hypothetical protein